MSSIENNTDVCIPIEPYGNVCIPIEPNMVRIEEEQVPSTEEKVSQYIFSLKTGDNETNYEKRNFPPWFLSPLQQTFGIQTITVSDSNRKPVYSIDNNLTNKQDFAFFKTGSWGIQAYAINAFYKLISWGEMFAFLTTVIVVASGWHTGSIKVAGAVLAIFAAAGKITATQINKERYQLKDGAGDLQATALKKTWLSIFSFDGKSSSSWVPDLKATLFGGESDPSTSDIAIWDEKGKKIGELDGRYLADSNDSQHIFLDENGKEIAKASLIGREITVIDLQTSRSIATMVRDIKEGTQDSWNLNIYGSIDPKIERMLLIYGAYMMKHQSYFIKDT